MTSTGHTTVLIDVLNTDGSPRGRSVAVECWYVVDVDKSYGEDADGRRGTVLKEITMLDAYLNPAVAATLTSSEIEQVLGDARALIERRF